MDWARAVQRGGARCLRRSKWRRRRHLRASLGGAPKSEHVQSTRDEHASTSGPPVPGRQPSYGITLNSVRRFLARPSGVSLVVMGFVSPNPSD